MGARNRIEVMNGVNLDTLGRRDPAVYGDFTLAELEGRIGEWARELGLVTRFFQTNAEHELIGRLHTLEGLTDGLILNPGAWGHYSYAIRDALEIVGVPVVEVHLSDIFSREQFRHTNVLSELCLETIVGKGPEGYRGALERLKRELDA